MASEPKNVFAGQSIEVKVLNVPKTVAVAAPRNIFAKSINNYIKDKPVSVVPTPAFVNFTPAAKIEPEIENDEPKLVFKGAELRKQIIISRDLVTSKFPLLDANQITEVISLVRSTVITSVDQIAEFGIEHQKQLSALLDQQINLIQSSPLEAARADMAKIIQQLSEFDIDGSTLKSRVLSIFTNKSEQFKSNYSLLEDCIKSLDSKIIELRHMRTKFDDFAKISKEIEKNVNTFIAAATLLKDHTPKEMLPALESRIVNLNLTLATIASGKMQHTLTLQAVNSIIDSVINVLTSDLPMWKTNVVTFLSTKSSVNLGRDLIAKRNEIISKLNQV